MPRLSLHPPIACVWLLPLLGALTSGCAHTPGAQRHRGPFERRLRQIDLGVGARDFRDPGWAPNERAVAFTFDYQEREGLGPLALEGGVHGAYDRASRRVNGTSETFSARTLEFSAGLRKNLELADFPIWPYAGAGGSLLFADLETTDGTTLFSDEDWVLGTYWKVGLMAPVGKGAHIALEFRVLYSDVLLFDGFALDGDADQIALLFGSRF